MRVRRRGPTRIIHQPVVTKSKTPKWSVAANSVPRNARKRVRDVSRMSLRCSRLVMCRAAHRVKRSEHSRRAHDARYAEGASGDRTSRWVMTVSSWEKKGEPFGSPSQNAPTFLEHELQQELTLHAGAEQVRLPVAWIKRIGAVRRRPDQSVVVVALRQVDGTQVDR